MTLDRLLGRAALVASVSLFGYNCDTSDPVSCVKDTDCKEEQACVSGVCQQQGTYGGDASSDSSGKYTCESGAKMVYERCYKSSSVDDAEKRYQHLLTECKEEITKGKKKFSEWGDDYFNCMYNACASGYKDYLTTQKCEIFWP